MEGNVWSSDPHLDAMCSMVLKIRANYEEDFASKEKLTDYFKPGESIAGRPPIMEALLTEESADVQTKNIKRMLIQGASMNEKDHDGVTPLMLACLRGCRSTVRLLLAQGPSKIEVRNFDNARRTALMFACAAGQDSIVETLLEFMKNNFTYKEVQDFLDAEDIRGHTAAGLALENGNIDCLNVLSCYFKYCQDEEEKSGKLGARLGKTAKFLMHRAASTRSSFKRLRSTDNDSSRTQKSKNLIVDDIPIRSRSWQDVSIDTERHVMLTSRSHVTLGFDPDSCPNVATTFTADTDSYCRLSNRGSNSLDSLTSSNDSRLFLLDPSKKGKRPANKFSLFSKTMKRLIKSGSGGNRNDKKRAQCYSTDGTQADSVEKKNCEPSWKKSGNKKGTETSENVDDFDDISDSTSDSSNDTETFNLNFEK